MLKFLRFLMADITPRMWSRIVTLSEH